MPSNLTISISETATQYKVNCEFDFDTNDFIIRYSLLKSDGTTMKSYAKKASLSDLGITQVQINTVKNKVIDWIKFLGDIN